ncbi:hypothetical protein C8J57DRAFT_1600967 [Mycena rebaudengoi]|nr:hypothetical protein C8J57DRAFT_1636818 [Mycena rebaudengoi]KAJ7271495.1 hypothetical protein C8J57DRAFT_1600967 [Mycena rebaudengoi]
MRATSTYLTILMVVAQVSFANWAPEKGAQINFYTDARCGQYTGEVAAWWNNLPAVGVGSDGRDADCITLNMPGNSKSINTVGLWPASTVQPGTIRGHCSFWDGFTCSGNKVTSEYHPGSGFCEPARSIDGFLWKSTQCWLTLSSVSSS